MKLQPIVISLILSFSFMAMAVPSDGLARDRLAGACSANSRAFANPGPSRSVPGSSSATSEGVIAIVLIPVATAVKTLPCGLRLVAESILPGDVYPVAMFIGRHSDLSYHLAGLDILVAKAYNEATFTMAVRGPFSQQPYNYTSKIIVDNVPAQIMGRLLGYPKVLADIEMDHAQFSSHLMTGESMVQARFMDDENYDPSAFDKNKVAMLESMNALPTIGKSALGFICFDFSWATDRTTVSPASADLALSDEFLGRDLAIRLSTTSLARSPIGSFRIKTQWKMSGFRKCQ